MKVEWLALADGIGQDSRGAITAIALSQNVFQTAALPAVTKRAVIVHITDEPGALAAGDKFNVTFNVINPQGKVITAQSGQVAVGPLQWPDLPVAADLPAEIMMNISEYGTYRIEVTVQPHGGEEIVRSVELYAIEASSGQDDGVFSPSITSDHLHIGVEPDRSRRAGQRKRAVDVRLCWASL